MRRITRVALPVSTEGALNRRQEAADAAHADNPWDFLDFDPDTNTFVARFDTALKAPSARGTKTVEVLQLDRREALEAGYRKTNLRLVALAKAALQDTSPDPEALCSDLRNADDHGLLGWYFSGTETRISPFHELRERHPAVWQICVAAFA